MPPSDHLQARRARGAHRSAADGFGRIDRKLEMFVHRGHSDVGKGWDELGAISDEVGNVETGAPSYMRRTYRKALKEVDRGAPDQWRAALVDRFLRWCYTAAFRVRYVLMSGCPAP